MKKKAFTLAETLITLLIIGIISALMLPAVNKAKPDEVKVKYLRTYSALEKTILSLINNPKIYPIVDNDNNRDHMRTPLSNLSAVNYDEIHIQADDASKLCQLLAHSFNAPNNQCRNQNAIQFNNSQDSPNWSFRTADGIQMFVSDYDSQNNRAQIVFDINGAQGNNCIYDSNNANACPNPDRFSVYILSDGTIQAEDGAGITYLEQRRNWLKNLNPFHNNKIIGQGRTSPCLDGFELNENGECVERQNACTQAQISACQNKANAEPFNEQTCGCPCLAGYHEENGTCVADEIGCSQEQINACVNGTLDGACDCNCNEGYHKENGVCVPDGPTPPPPQGTCVAPKSTGDMYTITYGYDKDDPNHNFKIYFDYTDNPNCHIYVHHDCLYYEYNINGKKIADRIQKGCTPNNIDNGVNFPFYISGYQDGRCNNGRCTVNLSPFNWLDNRYLNDGTLDIGKFQSGPKLTATGRLMCSAAYRVNSEGIEELADTWVKEGLMSFAARKCLENLDMKTRKE